MADKARDIAYWTPGATLNSVVEAAIQHYANYLEKKEGVFDPRPADKRKLKGGRPIK